MKLLKPTGADSPVNLTAAESKFLFHFRALSRLGHDEADFLVRLAERLHSRLADEAAPARHLQIVAGGKS